MVKDKELVELGHPEYWNTRYASEQQAREDGSKKIESYEWFRTFEALKPFFTEHLPVPSKDLHILQLGCGNSTLTADLHTLGYTNQTSVDFSQVVIDAMKEKYASLNTNWQVMDIRDMEIEDKMVDVAIDKATLDAMIHGSLWDPPDDVRENVGRYVDEVARVLKPGGLWLYITFRQPHFVKPLLVREKLWSLEVETLSEGPGSFDYFAFIMTRHQDV